MPSSLGAEVGSTLAPAGAAVAGAQQEAPPPPQAPRSVTFPKPVERTLKNGLRVIVVERHESPLAAMQLTGRAGDMQVKDARLGGLFNMGGAAVANYVSILEPLRS